MTLNVCTATSCITTAKAFHSAQVCLGKQFTGGSLFFCNTGEPVVDFHNPMQMHPQFDFHPEIGTAVLDVGRLQHGTTPPPPLQLSLFLSKLARIPPKHISLFSHHPPGARAIESGTRCNLIMWGRMRPPAAVTRRVGGAQARQGDAGNGSG